MHALPRARGHRRALGGGRARPGRRRSAQRRRSAGARRQAPGGGAARAVGRGVRRDARPDSACPRRSATAASPGCASPSRSAPRRCTLGGHSAAAELVRLRADAQRHAHAARRAAPHAAVRAGCAPRRSTRCWRARSGIDVHGGQAERRGPPGAQSAARAQRGVSRRAAVGQGALAAATLGALAAVAAGTALGLAARSVLNEPNVVMIYLLGDHAGGVARSGAARRSLASVLSTAAYNFFFVPPLFTFDDRRRPVPAHLRGADGRRRLIGELDRERAPAGARRRPPRATHRAAVRDEPRAGGHARRRAAWRASRCATSARSSTRRRSCCCPMPTAGCATRRARRKPSRSRCAVPICRSRSGCSDHGQPAGLGTDTLPGAPARYLPLDGERPAPRPLGVLAVLPANPRRILLPEAAHLLETFAAPGGARPRTRAPGRQRAGGGGRGRGRVGAQQPAGGDLARHAHAAGGDRRRREHAGADDGGPLARRSAASCAATHRRRGGADDRARRQRARHDAARVGSRAGRAPSGCRSRRPSARRCARLRDASRATTGRGDARRAAAAVQGRPGADRATARQPAGEHRTPHAARHARPPRAHSDSGGETRAQGRRRRARASPPGVAPDSLFEKFRRGVRPTRRATGARAAAAAASASGWRSAARS